MLALVGPDAGRILTGVAQDVPPAEERTHEESRIGGATFRALKWSDAGPPGWHLWVPAEAIDTARQAILEAGAAPGSDAAWTLLQIESGVAAFGRELGEDVIPLERRPKTRSTTRRCYPGQEVIARLHVRAPGPASHGPPVRGRGAAAAGRDAGRARQAGVAVVTASAVSPELGAVALAYVHRDYCAPGTRLTSGAHSAEVAELPLIPPTA